MKRKMLASLLLFLLLLTLAGCGRDKAEELPVETGETVDGWIPEKLPLPDDLMHIEVWETDGDTIWLGGATREDTLVIAGFDTLAGQWRRVDFTTADAYHPELGCLSAGGHSLWGLCREGPSREDLSKGNFRDDYGYYVLHIDLTSGESTAVRVPFAGEGSTEGSGLFFTGLLGLDDSRALLAAFDSLYLIDRDCNVLSEPTLPVGGQLSSFRLDGTRYLRTQEGYAPLDEETLSLGAPLDVDGLGEASSNNGHLLRKWQRSLCVVDRASGESELLFRWMDVALSYGDLFGGVCLENSLGDVYYPDGQEMLTSGGLIVARRGQVPVKETLRLGCFGDTSGAMYEQAQSDGAFAFQTSHELLSAIVRFNNTDPQYRIEVVPLTFGSEQERSRVLIELATRRDLDLLDTSLLPDNALDSGLLADMLPLLDADETIGREDFIEPLFALMTRSGGLYEYTDKFTMLTVTTHPELFPGREGWTVEAVQDLIAAHPEMDALWHSYDRELILTLFTWAATAEFADHATGGCRFDSPAFVHWLKLMKALPDGGQYSEEPKLLNICYDLAGDASWSEHYMMKGDYVIAGFPETEGTGSYFLKLGSSPSDWRGTMGENTRLGILAASERKDGAWRFVRTLMEGAQDVSLSDGIPVFKESFERALESAVTDEHNDRFNIDYFTASDAEKLREQVYGSAKLVDTDPGLCEIIRVEARRYLGGQLSAQEAAENIQSRASVYLAEQYG